MIVTGAIMAIAVVLILLVAVLPAQVQTQVRGRITRGTNQLFKILDGTANAFAVVVVIWMLGTLIGAVLLVAAMIGR